MTSPLPYGPRSAAIRRFLVQLAGLGAADRARVVAAWQTLADAPEWHRAERVLADTITRSDRDGAREALSGPLLQLVRRQDAPVVVTEEDALAALEPIAEPALAALLALMVGDLLDPSHLRVLLAPFDGIIDAAVPS